MYVPAQRTNFLQFGRQNSAANDPSPSHLFPQLQGDVASGRKQKPVAKMRTYDDTFSGQKSTPAR